MNIQLPQRRSIRLQGYDYSQEGLYFVTICCQDKICRFGKVYEGEVILNEAGLMIEEEWHNLKERFQNIELHEFVIMPNHFHGIIEIMKSENVGISLVDIRRNNTDNGQTQGIAPTLGKILDAFKSRTTVQYIKGVYQYGWEEFDRKLWQRNYYEHIIRNSRSYQNISDYIKSNPLNWLTDNYYNEI